VRLVIEVVTTIIWLPMELMVIAALLRGQYRRFPFILAFVVAEFLAVAAEIPAYWAVIRGVKNASKEQSWLFVLNELVLQALIYAVVISLIYQATKRLKSRRVVALGVIVGAIVFAGASFAIHSAGFHVTMGGAWVVLWSRDLNFCSAFLDLGLWTLLISSRQKDSRLLLISGGLGIRFTGEAIGSSLRQLAIRHHNRSLSLGGGLLGTLVDLLCLFIWWQALRDKTPVTVASPAAVKSGTPQKEGSRGTSATPW
jgi:hypothetical protein